MLQGLKLGVVRYALSLQRPLPDDLLMNVQTSQIARLPAGEPDGIEEARNLAKMSPEKSTTLKVYIERCTGLRTQPAGPERVYPML